MKFEMAALVADYVEALNWTCGIEIRVDAHGRPYTNLLELDLWN